MSKRPSIKKQIIDYLQDISRFGESKHKLKIKIQEECKKQGVKYSNSMVLYIYSYNSFNAYKDSSMQFVDWLRDNNIKPKYIDHINKKQAVDYLQYKQNNNYSSYSISSSTYILGLDYVFFIKNKRKNFHFSAKDYPRG